MVVLTAETPQRVLYMYRKCPTLANYVHTVSLLQLKGDLNNCKRKCIAVSLSPVWAAIMFYCFDLRVSGSASLSLPHTGHHLLGNQGMAGVSTWN